MRSTLSTSRLRYIRCPVLLFTGFNCGNSDSQKRSTYAGRRQRIATSPIRKYNLSGIRIWFAPFLPVLFFLAAIWATRAGCTFPAYCATGRAKSCTISKHLRAGEGCRTVDLHGLPGIGHRHARWDSCHDQPHTMETGIALGDTVLADGDELRHVPCAYSRNGSAHVGKSAVAPGNVFSRERDGLVGTAENTSRCELHLAIQIVFGISRCRLETNACQLVAAAATQGGEGKNQEEPEGARTKSSHDPPPERNCYGWDGPRPAASCLLRTPISSADHVSGPLILRRKSLLRGASLKRPVKNRVCASLRLAIG